MSSICENQNEFDIAFEKALDKYQENQIRRMTTGRLGKVYTMASIIYFAFIIWAIILAMRVKDPNQRIVHITLALVVGPAYVFGYYLSL